MSIKPLQSTKSVYSGELVQGDRSVYFAVRSSDIDPPPYRFPDGVSTASLGCAGLLVEYDDGPLDLQQKVEHAIDEKAPDAHCSAP